MVLKRFEQIKAMPVNGIIQGMDQMTVCDVEEMNSLKIITRQERRFGSDAAHNYSSTPISHNIKNT